MRDTYVRGCMHIINCIHAILVNYTVAKKQASKLNNMNGTLLTRRIFALIPDKRQIAII